MARLFPNEGGAAALAASIAIGLIAGQGVARAQSATLGDAETSPRTKLVAGAALGAQYVPVDNAGMIFVPFSVDLGGRYGSGMEIGAGLEGAPSVGGTCNPCRGWRARASFHARLHLAPDGAIDPWLGVGTGVELLAMPGQVGVATSSPFYGIDVPSLELGLETPVDGSLRIGAIARGELVYLPRTLSGRDAPAWMTNNLPLHGAMLVRASWSFPTEPHEHSAPPERHAGRLLLGMSGAALAAVSTYFAIGGFTAKRDDDGVARGVGVLGLIGIAAAIPMMIVGFSAPSSSSARDPSE